MESEEVTIDHFYRGKVTILQGSRGYRFSVDAPILADFLPYKPEEKALEIGSGCGVISLLALYKKKYAAIYGIEIQERLARLSEINGQKNGFAERFKVIHGDFKERCRDFAGIKEIFCNPPFQKIGTGRLSPDQEIRDAKFETRLNLEDLLTGCAVVLGKEGSVYLIFPYARCQELLTLAERIGLYAAKKRLVFASRDGKPDRFLVQLTNHKVATIDMEPLIIFKEKGVYGGEIEKIFSG